MIIIKGLIAIITFLIVPEFLGLILLNFWKEEKNNAILAFVLGYFVEFAVAELVCVPIILLGKSFSTLLYTFLIVIIGLFIYSLLINMRRIKEIFKETKNEIKRFDKKYLFIILILIILQLGVFIRYTHINDDDAYYVGTATISVQTNTLYKYSALTGSERDVEQNLMRYRLGPFPMYYALLSKILSIHPAIVAHFILPLIFLPIIYMIYYLIGKKLFKNDMKSTLLFMIFVCTIYLWGNYSIRTSYSFFVYRLWQGKSLLANMVIPALFMLFLYAKDNDFKFISYFTFFVVVLASNFTTTMGIAIPPIIILLLIIAYRIIILDYKNINKEDIKNILRHVGYGLISCSSSIIYGVIFLLDWFNTYF